MVRNLISGFLFLFRSELAIVNTRNPALSKDATKTSDLTFDINQNLKDLKSQNSPKINSTDCTPLVDRKGGVQQFDFRSVLKHTSQSNKTLKDRDKIKLPCDKDSTETDFRNVLKHKRFSVESGLTEKVNKLLKEIDPNKAPGVKKPGLAMPRSDNVTRQSKTIETQFVDNYNTRPNREPGSRSALSQRLLNKEKNIKEETFKNPSGFQDKRNVDFRKIELKKANTIQMDTRSFHNRNVSNRINGQPVSQVLQKFESNQATAKVDFRNVLKHRKENELIVKKEPGVTKMENQLKTKVEENHVNAKDKSITPKSDIFNTETDLIITDESIRAKIEEELKNPPVVLKEPKPRIRTVKPTFKNQLVDQTVPYGSEVILECQVTGKPDPEIKWSINDKEIKVRGLEGSRGGGGRQKSGEKKMAWIDLLH